MERTMTPEQIRQNMLGNSTHAEARQIELQLAARSDIAAEAANVRARFFDCDRIDLLLAVQKVICSCRTMNRSRRATSRSHAR